MSQDKIRIRSLWRQPLVHFLLAAAAIFAFNAVRGTSEPEGSRRIIVTVSQVERMAALWQTTWGRAPSESELQALVRDHIREEVYYREALKLGLDVNDTVIRRRLRQKMEFLTTDDIMPGTADEAQLQDYYEQHKERYRTSPVFDFTQVYFSADHDGDAQTALATLRTGASAESLGDPISLPRVMSRVDESNIVRHFGSAFYAQLNQHEPGDWFGPISSGFGQHLVKITHKEASHVAAFVGLRTVVESDWISGQIEQSRDAAYEKLRAGYEIELEVPEK